MKVLLLYCSVNHMFFSDEANNVVFFPHPHCIYNYHHKPFPSLEVQALVFSESHVGNINASMQFPGNLVCFKIVSDSTEKCNIKQ